MSEFWFPYDEDSIRRVVGKKFGHAYIEDATYTIGNTTTEWITSDVTVDVQQPDKRLAALNIGDK